LRKALVAGNMAPKGSVLRAARAIPLLRDWRDQGEVAPKVSSRLGRLKAIHSDAIAWAPVPPSPFISSMRADWEDVENAWQTLRSSRGVIASEWRYPIPKMNLASSDMRSRLLDGKSLQPTSETAWNPCWRGDSVARYNAPQLIECARSVPAVASSDNGLAVSSHC
jgi:hypothetical protein